MVEHQREVGQSVARRAHNPKVEGSNPSLAINLLNNPIRPRKPDLL